MVPTGRLGRGNEPVTKAKQPPIDFLKAIILERLDRIDLSAQDLAKMTGIGVNTVRDLLRQSPLSWRHEYRKTILRALGISIADLPDDVQKQIAQHLTS